MTEIPYSKDALKEAKKKLEEEQARQIRWMKDQMKMTYEEIGRELGYSKQRVEQIYKGK